MYLSEPQKKFEDHQCILHDEFRQEIEEIHATKWGQQSKLHAFT
jgi:hypothetical protein